MNIKLDNEIKQEKKIKIFYSIVLIICVTAIIVTFVIQIINQEKNIIVGNNDDKIERPEITEDKVVLYKEQFNNIFENKVNYLENNNYKVAKIREDDEIIILGYQNNEKIINDYELDVNIPYINIKNVVTQEFNKQIRDTFEKKARDILNSKNNNVIYTVNYSAYVTNNILSLVVRSTLKEGAHAQRDIVQTYNYDLIKQKKCTIDTILDLKGITKKEAGQKIKEEIKNVQEKVEELAELGYSIYPRDYTNDIYSVNNITEYFLGRDNILYIIYAYGNQNHTSEMDIVIM